MNFREYKRSSKVGDVLGVQGKGTLLLVGDLGRPFGVLPDDTDVAVIENTFCARLFASFSLGRVRDILEHLGFTPKNGNLDCYHHVDASIVVDLSQAGTTEARAMLLADVFDAVTSIPDDLKIEVARVHRIWTPKRGCAALEQIGFKRVPDQHRMHHLVADLFFELSALDGRTSNEIEDEVLSAARCILTRGE